MLFDIKARDKGRRTCCTGRAETLPIQQLGDNNEHKHRQGNTKGGMRLLIDHISNYLLPPAAKLTPLQQLQNTIKMLYQCPLMSCFSGLLIFHLFNAVSKLHRTLGKWGGGHTRASHKFEFLLLLFRKQETAPICRWFNHSMFQNTVFLIYQCLEKSLANWMCHLLVALFP